MYLIIFHKYTFSFWVFSFLFREAIRGSLTNVRSGWISTRWTPESSTNKRLFFFLLRNHLVHTSFVTKWQIERERARERERERLEEALQDAQRFSWEWSWREEYDLSSKTDIDGDVSPQSWKEDEQMPFTWITRPDTGCPPTLRYFNHLLLTLSSGRKGYLADVAQPKHGRRFNRTVKEERFPVRKQRNLRAVWEETGKVWVKVWLENVKIYSFTVSHTDGGKIVHFPS